MKVLSKVMIVVVIIGVAFLAMNFLSSFKTEPPVRQQQLRAKTVQTQVVQLGDLSSSVEAFGRITSSQPVTLISEVSGIIQNGSVPFQPGQSFRKGQLIAKIDTRQIQLSVNSAKSDLLNALAQVLPEIKIDFPDVYPKWQTYFENISFDKPIPELPEADNGRIKLFLSRFNVYRLYFNVQNLEINQKKHYFYAPFDGAISSTQLSVGAAVRAGSQLGSIINLEDLEVEVPIATSDLRWIKEGEKVRFSSNEMPGSWFGKIKRISSTIDPQTQTVSAFISIDKERRDGVYEGIFLNADIPGLIVSNGFRVPNNALYNEEFVYLIEDGKLKFQQVDVARREKSAVIINGGLQNGDTLVVELLQGVASGMPAKATVLSVVEREAK